MTALYDQSVPFLIRGLEAASKFLKKAEGQADERKFDKAVVLGLRLAPDMFNLARQIMLVTDFAKGAGARCAGVTPPAYADEEKTFEELQARLAKTIEYLKTLQAADFDMARDVTIKVGGQDATFKAPVYFNGVALPNFYFHLTTAYDILRSNGFTIGKADFMGRG
jgi:uncharacterized protein